VKSGIDKKDQSFKGYETWLTAMKMNAKMYIHIFLFVCIASAAMTFLVNGIYYAKLWKIIFKSVGDMIQNTQFPGLPISYSCKLLKKSLWLFFLIDAVLLFFVFPYALKRLEQRAKEQAKDKYVRGSKFISTDDLNFQIKTEGKKTDLNIGNLSIPVDAETKHFLIVGRPGTGKTVCISQILERLKERKAKGIVYDFKGDYLSKFYDPETDIIFNPLDIRSMGWTVFNEVETFMDIDSIAYSLIPPAYQADPFWNDAARDVFAGIMHYLYQQRRRTNRDIWEAVTAPGKDIAGWLKKTKGGERGYRYIEDASSKQAMGVFAVMMQYTKSFEYMAKSDGNFSLREWVNESKDGLIFVTNYEDVQDTLRPVLSLFVDLLGRRLLSLEEDYNRRLFFLIDEFGTLQRLSTILRLLTLSRSKGGSVWLGIQDTGQIDKIYSHELRQAITNACGSSVIFAVADPDTSEFLSKRIGETEYIETEEALMMGPEDMRDGINLSRRKRTERLVLPSDLQNLKDLECMVKITNYNYVKTTLQYKPYPTKNEPFILRTGCRLDDIIAKEKAFCI